jgi:hypothetical protein
MGAAAIPLMIAGTASSAYGSYQEGLAQSGYYKYLANNSRMKAALVQNQAKQEMTFAEDQGARESQIALRNTKQVEGAQTVAAAENVGGGSVTSADIARDTFDKAHLDQMAIKYNADVKAWRAQNQGNLEAWNLNNEAQGYDFAARNAKITGKRNAFNSLLSGSSQVAGKWAAGSSLRPVQKYAISKAINNGSPFPVGSGEY